MNANSLDLYEKYSRHVYFQRLKASQQEPSPIVSNVSITYPLFYLKKI